MLFDPDAGRSTEEIIMYKWHKEWDAPLKAEIKRIAHKPDCSWFAVVLACLERTLEELGDPIARQQLIRNVERRETPFGNDPLLKKDG
jgi:hypothetical protein